MKTTQSKGWFEMSIENLRNRLRAVENRPEVRAAPPIGATVFLLKGEPVPEGAGAVVRVKNEATKKALNNGVAGMVIYSPRTDGVSDGQ
jgi:hypothetical protein